MGRARARAAGRAPPPATAAGCSCPTSGGRSTTHAGRRQPGGARRPLLRPRARGPLLTPPAKLLHRPWREHGSQESPTITVLIWSQRFVLLKESGVEDGAVVGVGALGEDPAVEQHVLRLVHHVPD
ncbi:hypothetical protein ZWY2020_059454 [Hordeum vulgare]|nr:hypothetical protein ZWY2020_059454 [Hordeum vulgare]